MREVIDPTKLQARSCLIRASFFSVALLLAQGCDRSIDSPHISQEIAAPADLGDPPQLSGWEIWRLGTGAHDVTSIEKFYSGGLWEGSGGRAARTGRFTQVGDLVCVYEPPATEPFCRRVRLVPGGAIVLSAQVTNEVSSAWSEYRVGERVE